MTPQHARAIIESAREGMDARNERMSEWPESQHYSDEDREENKRSDALVNEGIAYLERAYILKDTNDGE